MRNLARVQRVVGKVMEVPAESVQPEAVRGDFAKWDSLTHLTLIMELEAEFGLSLSLEEATGVDSVAKILALVEPQRV